jgi:putative ABC transport system substrate-binding protein
VNLRLEPIQPTLVMWHRDGFVYDRRTFIGSAALVALAVPRSAAAQPARKLARIGILSFAGPASELVGPDPARPSAKALVHGLRELGYVYGRDFVTEPRGGEGKPDLWPQMVLEMVRLPLDVIVAPGPIITMLKQATTTIPIVMAGASDPIGDGYVQSLNRPGGNVTGLSLQEIDTTGKRLELLKELVPSPAPVAVLWNNWRPQSIRYWQAVETAARKRGWKLLKLEVHDANEVEDAFRTATEARASSLLMIASRLFFGRARQLADLAARSRLPVMYDLAEYVEAGGLISYGADVVDLWRRAAMYVDRILKGTRPAELPVEQPSKFELVINRKAVAALRLTIPPALLARADKVID